MLVESQKRRESDLKNLEKRIQKDEEASPKKLRELKSQEFPCVADAKKAAKRLLKMSKYHELTDLKIIKINSTKTPNSQEDKVEATVAICAQKVISCPVEQL